METRRVVTLDVRSLPPWERHPLIFETFDSLQPGEALRLVNDHDPRPLRYEMMHERTDQFVWESHEEAPREWVATITKV